MSAIYKSDAGRRRVEDAYRSWLARWPVPAEFITVPTREGDTFIVVSGPKTAPPLILLHGSTGNATTWIGDIAAYARDFRCYCVDIIGEPGLSAPSRPDVASEAYVLWLDEVLAGLKLDRASFLGLSLGGWLAFNYAVNRADRVVALAGIAPAGICRTRNFIASHLPYFFLGAWGMRKIREAIMGPAPADTSPEVQEFMQFLALIATEFKPRIVTLPILSDDQVRGLAFPVFVVTGGRDVMLFGEETRDRLTALAPDAVVEFRPDARHYIPETSAGIVAFLKRVT